jgi:hypothetical protein
MIKHYCDECANFQPGKSEKNLCALGKELEFKVPKDMIDIVLRDWGHYKEYCQDFKMKAQYSKNEIDI